MPRINLLFATLLLLLSALLATSASANTIHLRYFESADMLLTDSRFQLYSVAALEGEQVTLVAYGLDEGLIPSVSLFDINGLTIAETTNPDQQPVAVLEVTIPATGLYTILVSRQSEVGGVARLMLFEGDPLRDIRFLDTVDPFLPSRAYLIEADTDGVISVSVMDDDDPQTPLPLVFASRGTENAPPPAQERLTPIDRFSWQTSQGAVFYTLNLQASPDSLLPTSGKLGAFLSRSAQFLSLATIQVEIGEGAEVLDFFGRDLCTGTTNADSDLLAGPGQQFIVVGRLAQSSAVEIIGSADQFWLVVNPTSPTGGSFIPKAAVNLTSSQDDCCRANSEILPPDENADNILRDAPQEGETAFITLPPPGGNSNTPSPFPIAPNPPLPDRELPPIGPGTGNNNLPPIRDDNRPNPNTAFNNLPPDAGNPPDAPPLRPPNNTDPNLPPRPQMEIVRPPLRPPLDPDLGANLPSLPSLGCADVGGGIFVDFGGSHAASMGVHTFSDSGCSVPFSSLAYNIVFAPAPYNPSNLCLLAFNQPNVSLLHPDFYICS